MQTAGVLENVFKFLKDLINFKTYIPDDDIIFNENHENNSY